MQITSKQQKFAEFQTNFTYPLCQWFSCLEVIKKREAVLISTFVEPGIFFFLQTYAISTSGSELGTKQRKTHFYMDIFLYGQSKNKKEWSSLKFQF